MTSLVFAGGPQWDVFLIAGQSNALGQGSSKDDILDATNPKVWQWPNGQTSGSPVIASEPLLHSAPAASDLIGFSLKFAKEYVGDAVNTPPNRRVLLVPCAVGGTRLYNDRWAVGGDLYLAAISNSNYAMAYATANLHNSAFRGVLWHQGESDVAFAVSAAHYQTALDAVIDGFRANITGAANSAFVCGQMTPTFIANDSGGDIDAVHAGVASRKSKAGYWLGAVGHDGGGVHYDAVGQRLNGTAAYAAYLAALSDA